MFQFNFFFPPCISLCCFCHQFQEQNTVPSLRKALKDVAMEKDAAVVARVQTVHAICFPYMFTNSFCSLLFFTHKVSYISVGGSFCPASYTQETSKGSRGRTVSSMQSVSLWRHRLFFFFFWVLTRSLALGWGRCCSLESRAEFNAETSDESTWWNQLNWKSARSCTNLRKGIS